MKHWQRDIVGTQFITYAQMAEDVRRWMTTLPSKFSRIVGLPRSGMTVAHMLAAHLAIPAVQIHGRDFTQNTIRIRRSGDGPMLVVDDCCSYGVAINEARRQIGNLPVEYAAVYARPAGRAACRLDYWFKRHADPQWLVLTEWNWHSHQDSGYIGVDLSALLGGWRPRFRPLGTFCCVFGERDEYARLKRLHPITARRLDRDVKVLPDNCRLIVTRTREQAEDWHARTGRDAIDTDSWRLLAGNPWPDHVFGIGLPRTGTVSLVQSLGHLGWKAQHSPAWYEDLRYVEAAADVVVAANWRRLVDEFLNAKFILTVRDAEDWWRSTKQSFRPHILPDESMEAAKKLHLLDRGIPSYHRHVAAVKEALGDRVLEFDVRSGWKPLCRYLGEPVPDVSFPHANKITTGEAGWRN